MARAAGVFKSTLGLSSATMLSRILGFLREILTAQYIGGGLAMSAWSYALMLPNLFRRIFGEGALGTALIPIIAHTTMKEGESRAREKFSTIIIWVVILLTAVTLLMTAGALVAEPFVENKLWKLALLTIPVVMPYCVMICAVGIATSMLNSFRLFFWPAMATLTLNIVLIAAIVLFCPALTGNPVEMLRVLSCAVLISGGLEILILGYLLHRRNMLPVVSMKTLRDARAIREIWNLALPGVIGMSALQTSMIADRTIAMCIGEYAPAALYYSDRLVYLPVGIFAVAFGTVSISTMSKLAAENRIKTVLMMQFASLRQLLYITIPIGVFIALFGKELLCLLFLRGMFTERALSETYDAVFYYAFGIPAFAAIKVTLAGFYSRKKMMTPVFVSIGCIALNITLNLILMKPMKQGGIALATVISSFVNNLILLYILRRELGRMPLLPTAKYALTIVLISLASVLPAWFLYRELAAVPALDILPKDLIAFAAVSILAGTIYIVLSLALGLRELRFVSEKLFKRFKRTR